MKKNIKGKIQLAFSNKARKIAPKIIKQRIFSFIEDPVDENPDDVVYKKK